MVGGRRGSVSVVKSVVKGLAISVSCQRSLWMDIWHSIFTKEASMPNGFMISLSKMCCLTATLIPVQGLF